MGGRLVQTNSPSDLAGAHVRPDALAVDASLRVAGVDVGAVANGRRAGAVAK